MKTNNTLDIIFGIFLSVALIIGVAHQSLICCILLTVIMCAVTLTQIYCVTNINIDRVKKAPETKAKGKAYWENTKNSICISAFCIAPTLIYFSLYGFLAWYIFNWLVMFNIIAQILAAIDE